MPNVKTIFSEQKEKISGFFPIVGTLVIAVLFAVATRGRFQEISNLKLIVMQSSITMVGALGTAFVLAHGNVDLSIGGVQAIACLIGYYASRIHPGMLIPACLLSAGLMSLLVGVTHVYLGVPAFISGLCVMFIGKGIVQSLAGSGLTTPKMYNSLGTVGFYVAVMAGVALVSCILFHSMKLGRYNAAIGTNPRAARLSGINVKKYKMLAFLYSGLCVGISAFLTLLRSGGITASTGNTFQIDCLIVMVLGGLPLSGGFGVKIQNVIWGSLIYFMLNNGLIMSGVPSTIVFAIKGLLFLLIVSITYNRQNGQMLS